jgi:hypothetical protein
MNSCAAAEAERPCIAVHHNLNRLGLKGLLGAHLVQASFTGMCPAVMTYKRLGLPRRACSA